MIQNKKPYIYESPDGGKTITRRRFGEDKKEIIKKFNEDSGIYLDQLTYNDLLKEQPNINWSKAQKFAEKLGIKINYGK